MSDPHRAVSRSGSRRADGNTTPARPALRSAIHRRRSLIAGVVVALALSLGVAGGSVLAQSPSRVTVRPGETLSDIALRHYGDAAQATVIAAANRILNPDLVFAGTELHLPAGSSAAGTAWTAPTRRVTVQAGETLSAIAQRVYGSADYAQPLAAANKIAQPDLIRAGQQLELPASLQLPAGRGAGIGGASRGSLAGRRICIDPGHGGADPGTAYIFEDGRTLREADIVLDISLALAQRLQAQGAAVTLTRRSDLTLDLSDRAYICNAARTEVAISVHLNGVDNRAVNGALALYAKPADQPLADVMAGVMQSGLFGSARADATNFGARHFGARVLLYTTMPAVLVEPAFLTNPVEARSLLAPAADPASRRAQIVRELERGIAAYLR
jgi:N-acetylmuramoyl-L-alanine amidase